ncbi:cell division protein FtsB [Pigmentiphaga litoralis]|uniref:Cell division protein FtsB n=1 Tax=Pigmentiphaga litoralis TaxID=516702 RepID=A0A7Y9IUP9_9BURK|nr:cell division protein FtsB [Pigmentiphaga litoralis]NYE22950.1 cell division protein FtsB [Pigmentiphaga litoralis]NYE83435.1 cell division protein FtsB [Pigmentiphaga litoralis]
MRLLTLIIALLLVAIQYPLWLGKGGWMRTWELERLLAAQHEVNAKLETRNIALDAEVRDLKSGTDAIEERARFELGMIREGEAFVQIVDASSANAQAPAPGAAATGSGATAGAPAPAARPAAASQPLNSR